MAVDALDPGPNGDYPHFPRDASGRPVWSDAPAGQPVVNGGAPMPRGRRMQRTESGDVVEIDVTPTGPDAAPIDPPVIPPRNAGD
ncbi:hypothetical protein [Streptodolium elevatio]|uniref:DUF4124 domain-containing protein n=1 Tax=Streptodolium elevatio TaxID=3157996 RepID=A0ABV3D9N1_9ACTN